MLKDTVIANKSYTVLEVAEGQTLDQIAMEVMKQDFPDFLLPFKMIYIDGVMELRYEITDGIRMSYQSKRMYKKDLIQQLISMLTPFRDCSDWMLDYHDILLDPQYVFVNEKDRSVRYIYIPVSEYGRSDKEIMEFFSRFVIGAELLDDKSYALEILRILQDGRSNLITLLDFLLQEKNADRPVQTAQAVTAEPVYEMPKPQPEPEPAKGKQGLMDRFHKTDKKKQSEAQEEPGKTAAAPDVPASDVKFGESDVEGQLMSSLYSDKGAKKKKEKKEKKKKTENESKAGKGLFNGLFGGKKDKNPSEEPEELLQKRTADTTGTVPERRPQNLPQRGQAIQSNVQPQEWNDDSTEMEQDDFREEDRTVLRLKLEHAGNYAAPEMIELNLEKGYITVGRYDKYGRPCSDFNFDHSLTFVSRTHFRVEVSGDGYRIIDLDSDNGTWVNDQKLVPNIAYDLHTGDCIVLSARTRLTYRVL